MSGSDKIAKLEADLARVKRQMQGGEAVDRDDFRRLERQVVKDFDDDDIDDERVLKTEIRRLEEEIKEKTPDTGGPLGSKKRKDIGSPLAEADGKLYCICQQTWDKTVPMIGCDICDEWYHLTCIGMMSTELSCIEHYACLNCQKKRKKNRAIARYKKDSDIEAEIEGMGLAVVQREIALVEAELQHLLDTAPFAAAAPTPAPAAASSAAPKTPRTPAPRAAAARQAATPVPAVPTTPKAAITPRRGSLSSTRGKAKATPGGAATPGAGRGSARKPGRKAPTPAAAPAFPLRSAAPVPPSMMGGFACRACRMPLAAEAKFCMECGTKVAQICSGCGSILPAAAKFCMQCGTPQ